MGVIQSDHVPLTTACCVISHIVNARRFITSISYNFNFINSIETKNKSLEIGMESRQNIVKRFAKPKVIGKSQSCYKLSFISFSKCKYLIWKLRKLKLLCQPISAVFSLDDAWIGRFSVSGENVFVCLLRYNMLCFML